MAMSFLLALNPKLDLQDSEGQTALHLAVKNADSLSSTRCVRYLLIRGARTDIKDKKNKLAVDYID
jgi:ankyrin repeat protein